MKIQTTFERYELKYLLDPEQKRLLLAAMDSRMTLDEFGRTAIRNLYYDTPDYRLIRRSLERPAYKEKLRVRSYRTARAGDTVFVELKKKYRSVVYKRRIPVQRDEAMACLRGERDFAPGQVAREIEYFRDFYATLRPRVFLSYEREAYAPLDDGDLRIPLDENILYRTDGLSLGAEPGGEALLAPGHTLLEIKTGGGMPLWLTHLLCSAGIGRCTFSKYGAAYRRMAGQGLRRYA